MKKIREVREKSIDFVCLFTYTIEKLQHVTSSKMQSKRGIELPCKEHLVLGASSHASYGRIGSLQQEESRTLDAQLHGSWGREGGRMPRQTMISVADVGHRVADRAGSIVRWTGQQLR